MKYKDKQKTVIKRSKDLKTKATKAELHIKALLDSLRLKYIFQKGFIASNNYCIVDFYLPNPLKICLEIDGKYHEEESQILRDANRTEYLQDKRGFKVLRITNENALDMKAGDLLKFLEDNTGRDVLTRKTTV